MGLINNTGQAYATSNPATGLMQGLQVGGQFGMALRQQQNAEQQAKDEENLKKLNVILTMAGKTKSKVAQSHFMNIALPIMRDMGIQIPDGVSWNDSPQGKDFIKEVSDIVGKIGVDYDKSTGLMLANKAYSNAVEQENTTMKPDDFSKYFEGMTKAKAADLASGASYVQQFKKEPEYQTPEAKTGLAQYQEGLLTKADQFDAPTSNIARDNILKENEAKHREENQGIDSDSGYMINGEPILRNTRTGIYMAGGKKSDTLSGLEKQLGGYAHKKEGLKKVDEESLAGFVKTINVTSDIKDTLKTVSTGVPLIGQAKTAIRRYMSKEDAIKFQTASDQLGMLGNEIIKGVPSNFDIQMYKSTLPSADYTYAENVARVNKIEKMLELATGIKIKNLMKTRVPVPDEVVETFNSYKTRKIEKPQEKGKTIIKVEENTKTGQKRYTYSDGSQEIK